MSHTPGPWQIDERSVVGQAFDGSWKYICEVVRGGTPGAADANRYLIAAAPELLEIVKALAETPWEQIHIKSLQCVAKSVLAKAEPQPVKQP